MSPAVRFAVNAPSCDVPVADSVPADALFMVRPVLPGAKPDTVWLLDMSIVLELLSRRVDVPFTATFVVTEFVVVSNFACDAPAVVLNWNDRVTREAVACRRRRT